MGGADELRDPRRAADRRDAAAVGRDEVADRRDEVSLARDVEAESRDRAAQERDSATAQELRHLVARLRLLRGEILDRLDRIESDRLGSASQEPAPDFPAATDAAMKSDRAALEALLDEVIVEVTREAALQGAAAGDRRSSARDRRAAADDRRVSAADRGLSAADREEAAIDRERVDFHTDLGEFAEERTGRTDITEVVGRALSESRERIDESRRLLGSSTERTRRAAHRSSDDRDA